MNVYVLAKCSANRNYTPVVFMDKNAAINHMRTYAAAHIWQDYKEEIDRFVHDKGISLITTSGQKLNDIILEYADTYINGIAVHDMKINIYYQNNTYHKLEVFECDIIESSAKEETLTDCPRFNENVTEKPKKIRPNVLGYSSHDCETFYECTCGQKFGSWTLFHQEKNENGTKNYCPHCKIELII